MQGLLVCLLGLCALSAWLALRLARRPAAAPVEAACLGVALPLLTLAAGYDFGQREHLMAVAALPYLFLAARRIEGVPTGLRPDARRRRCWPALGFALKPHFLAIPGLVEALVLLHRGAAAGRCAIRCPGPWRRSGWPISPACRCSSRTISARSCRWSGTTTSTSAASPGGR